MYDWKLSTAQLLMAALPTHDLTSALALTEAWLAAEGGWVPDDVGDPTGEGEPTGGEDPSAASAALAAEQLAGVNVVLVDVPVVLRLALTGRFPSGETDEDMAEALQGDAEARVAAALGAGATVSVEEYDWDSSVVVESAARGSIDASGRAAVAAEAAGSPLDPAAVATAHARAALGLGDTWVCDSLYTRDNESGRPIAATVRKYTTTAYTTLDSGEARVVVVRVDRASGRPASLVIIQ